MRRILKLESVAIVVCIVMLLSINADAQKRNTRAVKKTNTAPAVKPTPETIQAETPAKVPIKRNERPNGTGSQPGVADKEQTPKPGGSAYLYEFTRPGFLVSRVRIEHDENGKGRIEFEKSNSDEPITDPLQLSAATLERLNSAFSALNFLVSNEIYQHTRDFSHMGNIEIRLKKDGRERTAKYNWTENKDAKILMDEYRRIANQFVWMFDISVARENQPLESPKLLASLDSLIKRSEISDPHQLAPFLQELSDDERLPLIARNHAGKLVKQIEKK